MLLSKIPLIASLLIAGAAFQAAADPLTDLAESPQMRKFQSTGRVDDLYSKKYFKQGTNYGSVFLQNDGFRNLQTWIAPSEASYMGGKVSGQKKNEHVEAARAFTSEKSGEIIVRILVPHPKFVSMLKYRLIKPFSEIEPPELEVTNTETVEVRGMKADLYTIANGSCSLIVHLTRGAVVQLLQKECGGLANLTALADQLDIKRLERKLDS